MFGIIASIIDGVLVGLVYGLAAMGLTLIWGVMDVINLTHGTMIVAGMMALYLISGGLGVSPYFTLPPILIGGFFVGAALYWATPFEPWRAAAISLLVSVMGFAGGMTMSAIKRDRGVKDYGTLVEGHGGVLDRIDSLCFAAPVFFHVARFWFMSP